MCCCLPACLAVSARMPPPRKVETFNAHKGPRQKFLNSTKFDPYRHSEDAKVDASFLVPMTSMCCRRCANQLHWKVNYGKFQPQERPRKCNKCAQKTVALAYHHICQKCALEFGVCAKCQKAPYGPAGVRGDDDDDEEEQNPNDDDDAAAAGAEAGAGGSAGGSEESSLMIPPGFVDGATCDDPELRKYAGLDVSRVLQSRRKVAAGKEAAARSELRERERRTLLRKIAKGEIAPTKGLDDLEENDDDYEDMDSDISDD